MKFYAEAGTIFRATLKVESGKECYLALWDASHNYLAKKSGTEFQIDYPLTEEGDYYLGVSNWWLPPSDYPINYTLEIRTSDFVVVGHSNSFGPMNAIIAKLSSGGNLRWARILSPPGGATSFGLDVIETHDAQGVANGFVMTGPIWGHPSGMGEDLFIAKFDVNGNFLWANVVGGSGDDCGSSVIETNNGDLVVAGWTTSFGWDLLLARFNKNGVLQWAKAYTGGTGESGGSVIEVDNALFVTGATNSFGAGGYDLLLAKFYGDGTPIWAKTLGGSNNDAGDSLVRTWCGGSYNPATGRQCGIAITGYTESFGHGGDLLVTMFDLDGNYQWARTLNATSPRISDGRGWSIINDCYQVNIREIIPGLPSWIDVVLPINCKLAVTGVTSSWGAGGQDILFATFDYNGYSACEEIVNHSVGIATLLSIGSLNNLTTNLNASRITPSTQDVDPTVTPVCTTHFTQFTDVGPIDQPVVFEFAIITDNHLRADGPGFDQLIKVVDRINEAINAGEDIRFVMVLGDIGDEGYRCTSEPYIRVKEVLDSLQVPYIPLIGNHDVWYDDNDGTTSPDPSNLPGYEKRQEEIFNQIFSPEYDYLGNCVLPNWDKASIPVQHQPPNASGPVWSYFQNFAFDYMRYHFIGMDWNSRNDIYTSDYVMDPWNPTTWRGSPDLHKDVTGGTWKWFEEHLENYENKDDENILLFAHHPLSFVASRVDPNIFFAFNDTQYDDIVQSHLIPNESHVDKWFAGHWHVCDGRFLCCEENITDDVTNNDPNVGNHILTNIETRSVTPCPVPPGENIRLVRVHGALKVDFDYYYPQPQPKVNDLITFSDQSTTTIGTITTWDWDFGDGTHHTNIQNPTYRYTKPGIYKVTLTVETNTGLKGSIAKVVDVGTKQLTSDYSVATAYNNARKLVFDPETGVLHLVYTTGPGPGMLTYAKSTDQGNTWFEVTPSLLWSGRPALDVNTAGKPCVIGNWAGLGSGFDAKRREKPLGWFSYDGVSGDPGFGIPSMVVDSEDNLNITISYSTGTGSEIRYYNASPGGRIGGPEVVTTAGPGDCQFASIALNNSEVSHIIWQQGSRIDHSYRQSPNVWSPPVQISSLLANAQTPSLVADGGKLHAVWQEDDKVVYRNYTKGWSTPEVVSTLSSNTVEAYPQVVYKNGNISVVWADIVGGDYDIFYSWKTDTGPSWSSPVNLSNTLARSQYPQAAISIQGDVRYLYVAWTEGNGPTYDIRSICFSFSKTATGTGTAHFSTDRGNIQNLTAVPEAALPSKGKPNLQFPHGFFSFNITGLTTGQTVNVTIILPGDMPKITQYWKYHTPEGWYQIPLGSNDGDNIITVQLTDGGAGDDDGVANGIIVDRGGPGTPLKITETMYKNSITQPIDVSKIRYKFKAVDEEWAAKWTTVLLYGQKETKYSIEIYLNKTGYVTRVDFERWGFPIAEIPYKLAEQSLAKLPPGFAVDP